MVEAPLLVVLLWLFYPLWLAAGWLDYRCHRLTDLPRTSGLPEAAWHMVMMGQVGVGLLAALALAPSHAVLLGLVALGVLHLLASVADTRRADGRRRVGVLEQHVHSFLDVLPLLGLALYVALHWPGTGDLARADWSLRLREPALPAGVWIAVLAPALAFAVLPGWMEFRRAWQARRAALA
jgi:hypothetical protein